MTSYKGCRRSSLEIVMDILKTCTSGASISQILRESNLNYRQVQKYVNFMIKRKLIKEISVNRKKRYYMTKYGAKVLKAYNSLNDIINSSKFERIPSIEKYGFTYKHGSLVVKELGPQISKYEIYAKIISASLDGVTKTKLLYVLKTNTPWLNKHLRELMKKEMIIEERIDGDRRVKGLYRATNKGRYYLKKYNELKNLFKR